MTRTVISEITMRNIIALAQLGYSSPEIKAGLDLQVQATHISKLIGRARAVGADIPRRTSGPTHMAYRRDLLLERLKATQR